MFLIVTSLVTPHTSWIWSNSRHSIYPALCLQKMGHAHFASQLSQIWTNLIILSLSYSWMNCRKRLNKMYHLASNLLPHYHAKFECSTLLLYSTLFNASVAQNRLFTVCVTRDAKFCFLRRLICNRKRSVKFVCPQHNLCFDARTRVMPPVSWCVRDALLNAAVQNVYQAQSPNIPMMLNDVSSTQKYLIS